MQPKSSRVIVLFAVVMLVTLLVLITTSATQANSSHVGSVLDQRLQQATPSPTDSDASVAGSTDGIMWMGILIALIVLVPMLLSRTLWARQTQ